MDAIAKQLIEAISSESTDFIGEFLNTYNLSAIKSSILQVVEDAKSAATGDDLKGFTMAAMKGLCNGVDVRELTTNDVEAIAYGAAEIAERTLHRLSELQKQQS